MNKTKINHGKVYWITGLSGCGKTSVSQELRNILFKSGVPLVLLDGDELREIFGTNKLSSGNHNLDTRKKIAIQYSNLCQFLSKQGITVIIATISLYNEVYVLNRTKISNYYEIYLDVPVNELEKRDPKKIYYKYNRGLIKNVIGLDIPFDKPDPHLTIDFSQNLTPKEIAKKIFMHIS